MARIRGVFHGTMGWAPWDGHHGMGTMGWAPWDVSNLTISRLLIWVAVCNGVQLFGSWLYVGDQYGVLLANWHHFNQKCYSFNFANVNGIM